MKPYKNRPKIIKGDSGIKANNVLDNFYDTVNSLNFYNGIADTTELPEVVVTGKSPTGDPYKDKLKYQSYKGRNYFYNGIKEARPLALGIAGLMTLPAASAISGTTPVAQQFLANPYVKPVVDVGNGILTADGVYNTFTGEGLPKTYNFIKNKEYGKAALSGTVDALNLLGGMQTFKRINPIIKDYVKYEVINNPSFMEKLPNQQNVLLNTKGLPIPVRNFSRKIYKDLAGAKRSIDLSEKLQLEGYKLRHQAKLAEKQASKSFRILDRDVDNSVKIVNKLRDPARALKDGEIVAPPGVQNAQIKDGKLFYTLSNDYNPSESLTTGNYEVPLYGTNDKVTGIMPAQSSRSTNKLNVEKILSPYSKRKVTPDNSIIKEFHEIIPPDKNYIEALNKNIEFLERKFPGFKPFGSSVGVARANLPHVTHDIDGFMTAEDFAKFKGDLVPYRVDKNGIPQTYKVNIGKQYGDAGDIDINVINADPKTGYAVGDNAEELYRQFFPDEYYTQTSINSISPYTADKKIKINKTPRELLDAYDPETKTIMDSLEIDFTAPGKSKHAGRPLAYLSYGDPDKFKKALYAYANSNYGSGVYLPSRGKSPSFVQPKFNLTVKNNFETELVPKVPEFTNNFNNYEDNINLLSKMGFDQGDIQKIARDPKRMQNTFDYWFLDRTTSNRLIDTKKLKDSASPYEAVTTWNPESLGGNYQGAGLNVVAGGNAGREYGNIHSSLQPKINIPEGSSPNDIIDLVNKQFGYSSYKFTPEEVKTINQLHKSIFNRDIGEINNPVDVLDKIPESGELSNKFLKELSNSLGIDAITREGLFGTGNYRSMTRPMTRDNVAIGTPLHNSLASRQLSPDLGKVTNFEDKLSNRQWYPEKERIIYRYNPNDTFDFFKTIRDKLDNRGYNNFIRESKLPYSRYVSDPYNKDFDSFTL